MKTFNFDNTLGELLANKEINEIIMSTIPQLAGNPMLAKVENMKFKALVGYMNGAIPESVLDKLEQALMKIPYGANAENSQKEDSKPGVNYKKLPSDNPVNVLLFLADDMNYNTIGCYGCPVEDISPNLDKLASEGMRFQHAHVTIAVCQPSRQCILTGLYPHHNGAPGFEPISKDVTTLPEILREYGYYNGVIGKVEHCQPVEKFAWDFCDDVTNHEGYYGRSPYIYGRDSAEFFKNAKREGRPFFLMANSHDPHRPFAGSQEELTKYFGYHTYASRYYTAEEAWVPGFLPDLPEIRTELAQYYSSCHRCDESVGAVLKSLEDAGLADNTLVIFMSDNGMAFPFSKANCYLNSTRTPFIARWPEHIKPNTINEEDIISGIDFTTTVLEAVGITDAVPNDGRSYLPILEGKKQSERNIVFTQFNTNSAQLAFPIRCAQNQRFGYIFNSWADGQRQYFAESKQGLTYQAMVKAASEDKFIADRVRLYDYRYPEEFYDFAADPDALNNLIADSAYQEEVSKFRKLLHQYMIETNDPERAAFEQAVLSK